jgi:hypothetical protein
MLGIQTRQPRFFNAKISSLTKWIPENYHSSLLILFLYSLLAAVTLAPVSLINSIPNTNEYVATIAAIMQAKMALAAGQFPLRTMPLEYSGWFYPFYQFYSPSVFTFAGLIYKWVTPSNPMLALKLTLWLSLTLGGIFMYRLAFWFVKSIPAAFLAGVIYLSAPYVIIIVDRIGNLNEVVALGLLPAVLYYTFARFYFPDKNSIFVKAGISWYLLITTHIITFVYTSLFVGILLSLITLKNPRHLRNLICVGIAFFLACLLAMWYLAPIAAFEKFFVISATYADASTIAKFHPTFSHLLFSAASYTINIKNTIEALHPSIGLPILLSALLGSYALYTQNASGKRRADYWLPFLLILFFLAFFMAWSPINFWQWLPSYLLVGQYSWRLLSQVTWIGALLSAWAFCWLFKKNLDSRHMIIGTLIILVSTNTWYPLIEDATINSSSFFRNPLMAYNRSAYKINFIKYPKFVDRIDSSLIASETLKTGNDYFITKPLLQFAANPVIEMKSQLSPNYASRHLHLIAYANDNEIARKAIIPGAIDWKIDMQASKNKFTDAAPLRVKFVLQDENNKILDEAIPLQAIVLAGFINPKEIMRVPQIQPYCQQAGNSSSCHVVVPDGVNFLVLPALYYPKLLKITLDGKPVAFQSIMYEGSLMAGIIPNAGADNKIEIEFTGLVWANWVSCCAWVLIGLLILQSFVLYFLGIKKTNTTIIPAQAGIQP